MYLTNRQRFCKNSENHSAASSPSSAAVPDHSQTDACVNRCCWCWFCWVGSVAKGTCSCCPKPGAERFSAAPRGSSLGEGFSRTSGWLILISTWHGREVFENGVGYWGHKRRYGKETGVTQDRQSSRRVFCSIPLYSWRLEMPGLWHFLMWHITRACMPAVAPSYEAIWN